MKQRKTSERRGQTVAFKDELISIGGLHELLPEDIRGEVTHGELASLVQEHGTYRQLSRKKGKGIVLTADDVRHFLARIANMQPGKPPEPALTEVGYIVAYGDPAGNGPTHSVFVDWCPRGHELIALDFIWEYCDAAAKVISTVDYSYGDYLKWRAEMRVEDHWSHGKWFYRTDKVMRVFQTSEGV